MKILIARYGWVDRALWRAGEVSSRYRRLGWLAITVGRFRLGLLGVEWHKGWSLLQLWRL